MDFQQLIEQMKNATLRCVRDKYADFNGRTGRAEFWYFMLALFLTAVIFGVLRLPSLWGLIQLAVLIPTLAAGSRRLHDVGKSGWFQLVGFIPVLGFILLVYWMTLPSVGPNEYGDAPVVPEAPTALPPGAA